jgi:hypothetical protein
MSAGNGVHNTLLHCSTLCVPSFEAGGSSCKFVAEDGKPPLDWLGSTSTAGGPVDQNECEATYVCLLLERRHAALNASLLLLLLLLPGASSPHSSP